MITQVSANAFPLNICSFSTLSGSARPFLVQPVNHESRAFSLSSGSLEIPQCTKPGSADARESPRIKVNISKSSDKFPNAIKKPVENAYYYEVGDFIQKKVKTNNFTNPKFNVSESLSAESSNSLSFEDQRSGQLQKNPLNAKRISQIAFDRQKNEFVYHLDTQTMKKEANQVRRTRKEVLKEDPLLLLYFYERHLQFLKTPGFDPENLVKM